MTNDIPTFKSANEFSLYIEKTARDQRVSHLDAVLEFCAKHMIDPTEVASKINKSLKEKIENDFRELNYLPKIAQLDI
jgi:hypothetical protein